MRGSCLQQLQPVPADFEPWGERVYTIGDGNTHLQFRRAASCVAVSTISSPHAPDVSVAGRDACLPNSVLGRALGSLGASSHVLFEEPPSLIVGVC